MVNKGSHFRDFVRFRLLTTYTQTQQSLPPLWAATCLYHDSLSAAARIVLSKYLRFCLISQIGLSVYILIVTFAYLNLSNR